MEITYKKLKKILESIRINLELIIDPENTEEFTVSIRPAIRFDDLSGIIYAVYVHDLWKIKGKRNEEDKAAQKLWEAMKMTGITISQQKHDETCIQEKHYYIEDEKIVQGVKKTVEVNNDEMK